ncbi:hypothetical protein [Mycolicibacter kumamotonensis]|uniref:DUF7316 family protein n=1 Tax=Mycolicibacter kumamotonensis TaxID=354243 RepID=UPI001042201D|nr:hypothetical protein [Mycolicibacter kumamotonensis]
MGVEHVQYGLKLPNGTVAWDTYKNFDLNAAGGRTALFVALTKTAGGLDFDRVAFLGNYAWIKRTIVVSQAEALTLDDPSAVGLPQTGDIKDGEDVAEASLGDDAAVHEGHVGGVS